MSVLAWTGMYIFVFGIVTRWNTRLGKMAGSPISIFLRIRPAVLNFPGVMFTDDVSNKSGVVAYPIANARAMIDFQILYTRTDWSDPAIMERLKKAEKCEVLVPQQIPLSYIGNMPNG